MRLMRQAGSIMHNSVPTLGQESEAGRYEFEASLGCIVRYPQKRKEGNREGRKEALQES